MWVCKSAAWKKRKENVAGRAETEKPAARAVGSLESEGEKLNCELRIVVDG